MNTRILNPTLTLALILVVVSFIALSCAKEEPAGRDAVHHESPTGEAAPTSERGATPAADHQAETGQQWTCPMHPEITSEEPGQCPECNMNLVPMETETPQEWICECCPEVRSAEPGICPECNMRLIPAGPKESDGHHHEMESSQANPASGGQAQGQEWTCGMHPAIRSEEPGKCPICNMDLVPVSGGETDVVTVGRDMLDVVGAEHATAKYLPLIKVIRTVGRVEYDERLVKHVASRIPGRVEKLHADFVGVEVSRGAPLLSIYSPELITALTEYRTAVAAAQQRGTGVGAGNGLGALAEAARTRLHLWGLDDREIAEATSRGADGSYSILVRSPISGTVTEKKAFEGKYVKEGEGLYVIADLSTVWVIADVYEDDIARVAENDKVMATARAYPGEMFHGKVAFVDPFINEKTRAARVRMEIANGGRRLKPGMFVDATLDIPVSRQQADFWTCPMHPDVIEAGPGECPECGMFLEKITGGHALAIPRDAVIFAGERPVVYVARSAESYEPRPVLLGDVATVPGSGIAYYHVIDGLMAGERVITDAGFLVHSQARLTGQAASAYGGALQVEAPGHSH
jgi:Cu(I)/Ag(I) efflux system membrane fusion protein